MLTEQLPPAAPRAHSLLPAAASCVPWLPCIGHSRTFVRLSQPRAEAARGSREEKLLVCPGVTLVAMQTDAGTIQPPSPAGF